jgi:hypothetical protein
MKSIVRDVDAIVVGSGITRMGPQGVGGGGLARPGISRIFRTDG